MRATSWAALSLTLRRSRSPAKLIVKASSTRLFEAPVRPRQTAYKLVHRQLPGPPRLARVTDRTVKARKTVHYSSEMSQQQGSTPQLGGQGQGGCDMPAFRQLLTRMASLPI